MADFLVRHGLNPDKVVRFSITLTQVLDVPQHRPPEELLTEYPRLEGDEVWILEIGTYELDTTASGIPTRKINLTSLSDVDREIQETVEDMCQLIDWDPLKPDAQPPYVYWYLPNDGEIEAANEVTVEDVAITTQVYFKIRDSLPATGIDYSSADIELEVYAPDGTPFQFDITSEVELSGSPYDLQIRWNPPVRVWDEYGG
jgi:hypothetical protein